MMTVLKNNKANKQVKDNTNKATMCSNSLAVKVDRNSYKLVMADTSQLCPVPINNDSVDDRKVTSLLEAAASSYTPVRNNMKHNNNRRRRNTTSRGADDNADALHTSVESNHSTDTNSIRRHSSAVSTSGSSSTSGNANTNNNNNNGGATLRRKCQPLHKCATTNQSVSSIMRPSRYLAMSAHSVPGEVVDVNNSDNEDNDGKAKPRRRSCNESLRSQSMHSYFARGSTGKSQRSFSLDDQWVASGVDFSSSVEVYVFRN